MAKTGRTGKAISISYPRRGEIYLTALDPTVGHEMRKTRPALVIQNDTSNQYGTTTIVVPITSKVRLPLSPVHVLLEANTSTGLDVPSVAHSRGGQRLDLDTLAGKRSAAGEHLFTAKVDKLKRERAR
jgi:mRNA interferase MazF